MRFYNFYDNFLRLCNERNEKPGRAALNAGISKASVSRWSEGGGITDDSAYKLAKYFGITMLELLGEDIQVNVSAEQSKKSPADNGETLTEEQIENFIGSVTDKDTLLFMMEQIVKRQRELNEK